MHVLATKRAHDHDMPSSAIECNRVQRRLRVGTTPTDDSVLLARVARGDGHALRQLYLRYRPRLWRYLWQQLDGDGFAVEDALQDIFLGIWRGSAAFRGESRTNTWIFRIAHHQAAQRLRSAARHPEQPLEPHGALEAAADGALDLRVQPSHEDEVLDRLTLATAWDHLSAKHREALELVFQQGFTLDEVAQILDVPLGTVKSRISYARRALAQALDSQQPIAEYQP